jgi:hypothetical protein
MDGEERSHDGESRSNENDSSVLPSDADHGEREGGSGCHYGADADADEVHVRSEVVRVVPEEGESRPGHERSGPEEREILDHAIARDWPHPTQIGGDHRHFDAQTGDFSDF